MANIRISDEIYTKLKAFADGEMRSVANATEYLLNKQLENTPSPKNTNVSDLFTDPIIPVKPLGVVTPEKSESTPRGKGDVLADIRDTEAERDEELRYCQDDETRKKIVNKYAGTIGGLWNEYHFTRRNN